LGNRPVNKLACVIHDLSFGGSQRAMALFVNEFSKTSYIDVHLILYGNDAPSVYDLSDKVTVHRPSFRFDKRFRFLSTLRRLHFLRSTLGLGNYDAILSFGERWNNFVMLATLGQNIPVYLSDRSSPALNLGLPQTFLRKLLYPLASGLIAQTSHSRAMANRQNLNGRICVVPNPVAERQLASEAERENIILSVGRVIATKNYDRLLSIFASLEIGGWKLVIVGDDSQGQNHLSELRTRANRLNLSERVEFAGQQTDVQRFYDRAKIFAFTSSSEGFPNVVSEALSAGLPVVTYDCVAGPSDLIRNGENGFLIDLFDDVSFNEKLVFLMTNEAQRLAMSAEARRSVAHLNASTIAGKVLDFMQEDP